MLKDALGPTRVGNTLSQKTTYGSPLFKYKDYGYIVPRNKLYFKLYYINKENFNQLLAKKTHILLNFILQKS